ncbi:MAG: hypothetical protein IJ618_02430 [Prevotella sp.]|nr:hypothetical protein [Prevotella sp.]
MDKLIDLGMTKLFLLAEYVCNKIGVAQMESEPVAQPSFKDITTTIRFSKEDKMVEGELFK